MTRKRRSSETRLNEDGLKQRLGRCLRLIANDEAQTRLNGVDLLCKLDGEKARLWLRRTIVHRDPAVRVAAAEALPDEAWQEHIRGDSGDIGRLGVSRRSDAVDPLLYLFENSSKRRLAALKALAALGERSAVPAILARVPYADSEERLFIGEVLAKLDHPGWFDDLLGDEMDLARMVLRRDPRTVKVVIDAVRNPHAQTRMLAAEALGFLHDEVAIDPLILALWDEDWKVRYAATLSLRRNGAFDAVLLKLSPLLFDAEAPAQTRAAAAETLGGFGIDGCADFLIQSLGDEAGDVRLAAASALARIGDERWSALVSGTDSDELRSLEKSGSPKALSALIYASGSRDPTHAGAAKGALWSWEFSDPHDELVRALSCNDSIEKREAIAEVLGLRGDTRAYEALAEASDDPEIAEAAIEALCVLGDSRAKNILFEAIASGYGDPECIGLALGRFGDADMLSRLLALNRGNNRERIVSIRALGVLGKAEGLPAVESALNDPHHDLRRVASRARDLLLKAIKRSS